MAVGNAVVVCDAAGSGPMVTAAQLEQLAGCNFGRRLLRGPLDPARLDAVTRGALRIRQRPGPRNALGDIKFVFPGDGISRSEIFRVNVIDSVTA